MALHQIILKDVFDLKSTQCKDLYSKYLSGRRSYVKFRKTRFNLRRVRQGVPQGGVMSSTLSNSKIPYPPLDADDCTILTSAINKDKMNAKLNSYLSTLNE